MWYGVSGKKLFWKYLEATKEKIVTKSFLPHKDQGKHNLEKLNCQSGSLFHKYSKLVVSSIPKPKRGLEKYKNMALPQK